MKKLLIILSFVLVFALVASPVHADDFVEVGFTVPTYDVADFYGQYMAGVEKGLDEADFEYEMHVRSPADHTAHDQQLNIVQDFLTIGVDYLVVAPTSYEAQQNLYYEANQEGTPLLIGNYSDPFPEDWGVEGLHFAGYRHSDGGLAVAEYIDKNYPEGTNIAIIHGSPGYITQERSQVELHKENGMNIIYEHNADWDRALGYDAAQRILEAHPDVEIIIAVNSYMAMAAVEATESMDMEHVDVFGAGGILEELDAVVDGRLTGTWFRDAMGVGEASAEAIRLHYQGREDEIENSFNASIDMITSVEDIHEFVPPLVYEAADREMPELE